MAKQQHILLVILVAALMASLLHAATSAATTHQANTTEDAAGTVYDVLQQNNLPRGLLPLGVQSYVLHAGGGLEVTFPGECNFFVTVAGKKFQFRYASTVSGNIKAGSISSISGVRVQVAFAWLAFNQVQRAGNNVNFQLQTAATQTFPVSAFAESARCS